MDRIIVGVDFGSTSEQAAREAASLALATGAELHLITATKGPNTQIVRGGTSETWIVDDLDAADTKLEVLAATLRRDLGDDLRVVRSVLTGHVDDAIVAEAERIGADIIVVGNKRTHGAGRALGSVAVHVIRHAPCAVYVAHTT